MKIIFVLLSILFLSSSTIVTAQKKYEGTLFSKFGEKINGTIVVNLEGVNEDLIEVSSTVKTKTKRSKQTLTTTSKINAAIIDYLLINGKKYYLRDIKIDYKEKYLRNVCVELIKGTLNCGIFQIGDGKKDHSIFFKFPNQNYSELISIDFDYYANSTALVLRVMGCDSLKEKLINKDPSVSWEDEATREERIQKITTIIAEYNNCK
jgi:hypothetical protein